MKHLLQIAFIFIPLFGMSQTKNQLIQFADEQVAEGDYYGAINYYQKAMDIDSVDIDVLFKYAEALRLYKNYPKAEYYYEKVYKKGNGRIYPSCVFWLASMQKMNGNYKESAKMWKRAKTAERDKKSFEYQKAQQEVRSCTFARRVAKYITDVEVENIGEGINSYDSEFSPIIHNSKLYYSSLSSDRMGGDQQVLDEQYKVKIYSAKQVDSVWKKEEELERSINNLTQHNANGTFSIDGTEFYFTRCNSFDVCQIMVSEVKDGKFGEPKPVNINASGATQTQPQIALLDGKEVMFFASNRKEGFGKLDIWYAEKKGKGKFDKPVNAGKEVNSIDNEITPFYDSKGKQLYFSSEWHFGLGGFDVFQSSYKNQSFGKPENLKPPINTQWNDFYFTLDTLSYKGYLASNREGSLAYSHRTCCNDIYEATFPKPVVAEEVEIVTLEDLNKYLPVKLYFHNDCPNPRTIDTVTNLNYLTTYDDYIALVPKYQEEYSQGLSEEKAVEAELDITDFFKKYVEQGVEDLELFTKLLLIELQKGTRINMTVRGFASPLAKTDYNVKLTGRRISSLMNYLNAFDGGVFVPFIESKQLTFTKIPYGEYTASNFVSDNLNDQRNSVYSRAAALERKIEIVSVNLAKEASGEPSFDKEIHDFGKITSLDTLKQVFTLTNKGSKPLTIKEIKASCNCTGGKVSKQVLQPNEKALIEVFTKPSPFKGKQIQKVEVITDGVPEKKELSVTFELE